MTGKVRCNFRSFPPPTRSFRTKPVEVVHSSQSRSHSAVQVMQVIRTQLCVGSSGLDAGLEAGFIASSDCPIARPVHDITSTPPYCYDGVCSLDQDMVCPRCGVWDVGCGMWSVYHSSGTPFYHRRVQSATC